MKRLKYIGIFTGCLLVLLTLLYTYSSTDTYLGRWFKWRASDIEDYQKFPSFEFNPSPTPFHFTKAEDLHIEKLKLPYKKKNISLKQLIETTETTAFIIIRNDSLLYEHYASAYLRSSLNTSFSTAKSITSLLVGCAIADSLVDAEKTVAYYLPKLAQKDTLYKHLSLDQLLNMRSGLQFADHDLPWGDKPKAYYHPRLRERIMQLRFNTLPGERFQYNSYNPILIGMLLEQATSLPPAKYFEQRIWNALGMEYGGSWSADSNYSMMTKMESGLNLRAIDFAKFGRLVLHQGNWNGTQLIPASWIVKSIQINPAHKVTAFGEDVYYENGWWLYSRNGKSPYIIAASGHLGQYLYLFPEQNLILVRMGKSLGGVASWGNLFKRIAEQL